MSPSLLPQLQRATARNSASGKFEPAHYRISKRSVSKELNTLDPRLSHSKVDNILHVHIIPFAINYIHTCTCTCTVYSSSLVPGTVQF